MITRLFTALIRLYKFIISPLLPPSCRFYPTCSDYACGSIETHGVPVGAVLALKRLFRCHPFSEGGYDPVPNLKDKAR
ncbi:MAG: membrane protein insertion efficiency factor YidD [Deltaproteobacteria bacterium]|nr:membrane protein insertion efficiency factor YidD [Deltaproteobacteria bacterium]